MRLLQISVPDDSLEDVLEVLRRRQLGYTVAEGAADQADRSVVSFVLPADAVERVLDELESAGYDRTEFTVSVNTEFAHFEDVDEVQNRWGYIPNRLAPAALRSKAKDMRRNARSYVWMMILSAIVATAGLFLSSPAVVVGSMVIAPIVSPVLTANVGLVRNDRDMVLQSVHMQAYGLAIAVVTASVFAWAVRHLDVVPVALAIDRMELMVLRVSPSMLGVVIGLAAGAAGAYGLATKGDVTIVGVMIAAALIPTAAAVGIGVAWGNLVISVGALVLLVVSVLTVNVGGTVMLLYLGYRPDHVDESLLDTDDRRGLVVLALTVLFVVATIAFAGGLLYQQSSVEQEVNEAVSDVLAQDDYEELGVESLTVEYTGAPTSESTEVAVRISRPAGTEHPDLPRELESAIADRVDREVDVRVQFVDYARSD